MTAEVPVTTDQFVDDLVAIVREEGLRFRDPLLESVRAGTLSREGFQVWIGQAVLVVRQFTRFISAIHANCPRRDAQLLIAENLWEEHGRGIQGCDHFSLAQRLARSVGMKDEEIESIEPLPETTAYIDHCLKVAREASFVESMTAIGVGIEGFMPKFFGALADALKQSYGLTSSDVEYLLVHVDEDADHSRRALDIIRECADSEEIRERAKAALRETLAVKRRFAEAVFAAAMSVENGRIRETGDSH